MPAAKKTTKTAAATDAVTSNVTAPAAPKTGSPKTGSPKKATTKATSPKKLTGKGKNTSKVDPMFDPVVSDTPVKTQTAKGKEAKATPAAKAEKADKAPSGDRLAKLKAAAKEVLTYLNKNGRTTRMTLRDNINYSSVTKVKEYLEAEGLVVEVKREDDKNRHLELTEKGKKVAAE